MRHTENKNYLLSNGIQHTNSLITTPGMPIVIQNWAYCAALAWIRKAFGTVGPFTVTILMITSKHLVVQSLVIKICKEVLECFGSKTNSDKQSLQI